jgi:hypothetical protein
VASSPQSLRADFEALNKKTDALFIEAMRSYNRQDKSSLEALKKRVGISDIGFLQKIQDALEAVANNESFEVKGLPEIKKRTANERSFATIGDTRARNVASVQKNIFSKSKSSYDALLKRATVANDLGLAKEIHGQMVMLMLRSSPVVGKWRENGESRNQIVFRTDGGVWHENQSYIGYWKETGGSVTISDNGEVQWKTRYLGTAWKISADGKTLTDAKHNWGLFRE